MSDARFFNSAVPGGFRCKLDESAPGVARVVVTGELDLATGPALERKLHDALVRARLIVLDLRGVSFCDSTGLHLILRADERARAEGRGLVIVRGSQQVQRLFALTCVDRHLEIVDDMEEAMAGSPKRRAGRTTRAA